MKVVGAAQLWYANNSLGSLQFLRDASLWWSLGQTFSPSKEPYCMIINYQLCLQQEGIWNFIMPPWPIYPPYQNPSSIKHNIAGVVLIPYESKTNTTIQILKLNQSRIPSLLTVQNHSRWQTPPPPSSRSAPHPPTSTPNPKSATSSTILHPTSATNPN